MKKILLLIIIILMFSIAGCDCKKNPHYINISYEESKWTIYLNQFYEEINTEGRKYVAFDLRSKEQYETEHLRQFQNYDLSVGTIDEFSDWLSKNYSNKYVVYIYVEILEDHTVFDELSKKFKLTEVYVGEYHTLRTLGEDLFTFDSGPYDCNC